MGRTATRTGIELAGRVQLLEDDLDTAEAGMAGLRAEIAALRQVLVGLLVAVTTACILMAINLAVGP